MHLQKLCLVPLGWLRGGKTSTKYNVLVISTIDNEAVRFIKILLWSHRTNCNRNSPNCGAIQSSGDETKIHSGIGSILIASRIRRMGKVLLSQVSVHIQEGSPSPSHNTSTGPMFFPGVSQRLLPVARTWVHRQGQSRTGLGYPLPPPRDWTPERVLGTRRAMCHLRSRRRTFLLGIWNTCLKNYLPKYTKSEAVALWRGYSVKSMLPKLHSQAWYIEMY